MLHRGTPYILLEYYMGGGGYALDAEVHTLVDI